MTAICPHKKCPNLWRIFLRVYLNQTDVIAKKQDFKYSGEWQFAVSSMHLELRKYPKEDYMKHGESKAGIGLQNSKQDYMLSKGWLYFEGFWKRGLLLVFQKCVNLNSLKTTDKTSLRQR